MLTDNQILKLEQLPTTSAITSNPVNAETFSHITFSISNPNLSLQSVSLQSDGLLSLKVKIIGTPATTPVVSNLNYTFNDGFTSFTGKLPIEVNADFVITGVSVANWTNIGVPCPTMNKSATSRVTLSFNNSIAPTTGTLKWAGFWDNQSDGIFEGVGSILIIDISSLQHSGNELYLEGCNFCWGLPSTVLKNDFQYISPTGYQSPVYSSIVPRP